MKGTLELVLSDGSVYPERGKASVANREVDVKTGTLMIVALFPNPRNLLRPGQYAKVRATTRRSKDALLVPQRAVQELQGTHQVAVVGADNKVCDAAGQDRGRASAISWVIDAGLEARRANRRRGSAEGARRRDRQPEAGRACGERKAEPAASQ